RHPMPIKFPCPHCKKTLSVKDHLAGKKATCPACKGAITIPSPSAQPAAAPADVDELAAAAFASEPAQKAAPEPTFVEFTCYYCDEPVKVSAELAGKQTPCPSCRKIIKLPQLVKTEPKDWRKTDPRGPSGARGERE